MRSILVAAALLLAAFGAQAGGDNLSVPGASSVAEMMQRKQEHQLREQLAKEGRWDEIRQMDEENARRQHEQHEKSYLKMNQQLSRSGTIEGPVSAKGYACETDGLRVQQLKPANQGNNAAGSSGY